MHGELVGVGGDRPRVRPARLACPNRSSGTPITAASATVGCCLQRLLHLFGEDLLAGGVDAGRAASEQADGAVGVDAWRGRRGSTSGAADLPGRPSPIFVVLVVAEGDPAAHGHVADVAGAGSAKSAVVQDDGGQSAEAWNVAVSATLSAVVTDVAMPARLRRAEPVDELDLGEPVDGGGAWTGSAPDRAGRGHRPEMARADQRRDPGRWRRASAGRRRHHDDHGVGPLALRGRREDASASKRATAR